MCHLSGLPRPPLDMKPDSGPLHLREFDAGAMTRETILRVDENDLGRVAAKRLRRSERLRAAKVVALVAVWDGVWVPGKYK